MLLIKYNDAKVYYVSCRKKKSYKVLSVHKVIEDILNIFLM